MKADKVNISCMALLTFLMFIVFDCGADAALTRHERALNTIYNFAERYCEVPLKGEMNNFELSGSGQIGLDRMLKKLVNLGIQGVAKYQSSEWKGGLQKDIAGIIRKKLDCKMEVLKYLSDKLLPSIGSESKESGRISNKMYMRLLDITGGQTKTIEALVGQLGEKDRTIKERDAKIESLTNEYKMLKDTYDTQVQLKTLSKQDKENLALAKEKLDNGDLKGATVVLSAITVTTQVGQPTVSQTSAPFKVCKNQTPVQNSGIAIFVNTIELDNNSGHLIVYWTTRVPEKEDKEFSGQIGTCRSYYHYAIRLHSVSTDCAEFIISQNEKPCE